jgi:hypothetical protein
MNRRRRTILAVIVCLVMVSTVFVTTPLGVIAAQSVDLSTWTAESYVGSPVNPGNWILSDATTVTQTVNGDPTFFYSDFNAYNTKVEGTMVCTPTADDDYIGFAIGFQPGDTSNASADYLLVDWKRNTQSWNFPGNGLGGTADRGLAVSRVKGIPFADELWQHIDYSPPLGQGVTELARGKNLGDTGWTVGQNYVFTIEFTPTSLKVYVNGDLEIHIKGDFEDGRFAFYSFSQPNVTYSNFTVEKLQPDTGGGWFEDEGTDNMINFGFTARPTIKGQFQLVDHDSGTIVHGKITDWVDTSSPPYLYYTGTCSIKGEGTYDFELRFEDNGEPGVTAGDYVEIDINSFCTYSGILQGGNIQDHQK